MAVILLLFLAFTLPPALGLVALRRHNQNHHDRQRQTYRIVFPPQLAEEQIVAWLRSMSGTLAGRGGAGSPTLGLEVWSNSSGIQHRLRVPWRHADFIVSQLRSLIPGIRVTPEEEFPYEVWTSAVEVGLSNSNRPLRIFNSANVSASMLAAIQPLQPEEAIVIQWVISPAAPSRLPAYNEAYTDSPRPRHLMRGSQASRDEINERRAKLEDTNMLAVLRIGSVAKSQPRADHLVSNVRAAFSANRSASTRFTKRPSTKAGLQKRIATVATPLRFPMRLAAPELAALLAWPIGNPFVTGLPSPGSRQLPAPDSVPSVGRVLGRSTMPGNERPVAVAYADAVKHAHVMGPSGSGKSVLLANMLRQDMAAGYGVILIEPKGDLFHSALNYVPPERMQDVYVLDVNESRFPVGFNVLDQGNPRAVVDELCALFEHLYADTRSVWTREVLYHGLRSLIATPGTTFVDLATLLMPMTGEEVKWADDVRRRSDKELRQFWQRFENQPRATQDRIVQPVMDRIWQLNARPELRNIIGQSQSSFQMSDVIRNNKILLVNLEGAPKDSASLTGTLLMNALWHATKSNPTPQKPNFLYLDEFQSFINLPVDAEDMLAKSRSFGLGMVLAHQHLEQLPRELREAVLSNARTKVVFQTAASDARVMAREFGNAVDDHDFMHLGQYEAWARVVVGGSVSSPMSIATLPPTKGYGKSREIRDMSKGKYGRAISDVQEEMASRYGVNSKGSGDRPPIGSTG